MKPYQLECKSCSYEGEVLSEVNYCPRCRSSQLILRSAPYVEVTCICGEVNKVLDTCEAEAGQLKSQDVIYCMKCGEGISREALKRAA